MTVQPTEQWVQTFLRIAIAAPGGGGGPASAFERAPSGNTERRKAASSEAGAAQERAAINTGIGLPRELRRKRAAASVALRPLDQHGSLPHFAG